MKRRFTEEQIIGILRSRWRSTATAKSRRRVSQPSPVAESPMTQALEPRPKTDSYHGNQGLASPLTRAPKK